MSVSSLLDLLSTSLNSLENLNNIGNLLNSTLPIKSSTINGNLLGAYEGNSSKSNCGQEFHL